MTIAELDQEDLTLREVIHDLEKTIQNYRTWMARNEVIRNSMLQDMAANEGC